MGRRGEGEKGRRGESEKGRRGDRMLDTGCSMLTRSRNPDFTSGLDTGYWMLTRSGNPDFTSGLDVRDTRVLRVCEAKSVGGTNPDLTSGLNAGQNWN